MRPSGEGDLLLRLLLGGLLLRGLLGGLLSCHCEWLLRVRRPDRPSVARSGTPIAERAVLFTNAFEAALAEEQPRITQLRELPRLCEFNQLRQCFVKAN